MTEPFYVRVGNRDLNMSLATDVLYIDHDRTTQQPVAIVSFAADSPNGEGGARVVKLGAADAGTLKAILASVAYRLKERVPQPTTMAVTK